MPSDLSTFHALIFLNKVLERKYETMRISLFSSYFELLYPQISQSSLLPMLGDIFYNTFTFERKLRKSL